MTLHARSPFATDATELAETVGINDILAEMNGLAARFRVEHATTRTNGTAVVFAAGSIHTIQDWNGNSGLAVIDSASVPKLLLDPAPATARGVRRYDVGLAGQRGAVERNQADLAQRHPPAERRRLTGLLSNRQRTYSQMWVRQMMYNRFDTDILRWTNHYNAALSPADNLDPNIPKSIFFQESRMGTSGRFLLMPPYRWDGAGSHPIMSRFNIGQAIDSFGPQQWLMIREMAPAIATRHGLDALAARGTWMGMTSQQYIEHAGFSAAMREFFEARSGGNNLMGTAGKDLHLDYGFWIRTAIRWLFVKYRGRTWPEAVRAYNGSGARARAYRDAVMARVDGTGPITATDSAPAEQVADSGPRTSSGARLTWEDVTRIPNSNGVLQLFYVTTGAPDSVARAGDQGHAVFNLRVENRNSVYNHLDVETKTRLLRKPRNQPHVTVYPDPETRRGWNLRSQPELVDESSRVIPVRFPPDALARAYDSEWPMARVELEYHWREAGQSRQRQFASTGLDFVLVAPIEWMFLRRRHVGEVRFDQLPANNPAAFKGKFWLPVQGVNFNEYVRDNAQISINVSSQISRNVERQTSQTGSQSRTSTSGSETTTGFSLTSSFGASREASGSASIEILQLGIKDMMEVGFSQTFSHSVTQTRSTTLTREFARSITESQSYQRSQAISTQAVLPIGRPPEPPNTSARRGSVSIGVYLYPIVDYYAAPYVRFSDVNRFGQATRRQEGQTVVPFVREWRLIASAD